MLHPALQGPRMAQALWPHGGGQRPAHGPLLNVYLVDVVVHQTPNDIHLAHVKFCTQQRYMFATCALHVHYVSPHVLWRLKPTSQHIFALARQVDNVLFRKHVGVVFGGEMHLHAGALSYQSAMATRQLAHRSFRCDPGPARF